MSLLLLYDINVFLNKLLYFFFNRGVVFFSPFVFFNNLENVFTNI
jgi:hypothetical protein